MESPSSNAPRRRTDEDDVQLELPGVAAAGAAVFVLLVWETLGAGYGFATLIAAIGALAFTMIRERERERELRRIERTIASESRVAREAAAARELVVARDALEATARRELKSMRRLRDETWQALKEAQHEFDQRAFAPFWDAIERAANRLAEFEVSAAGLDEAAEAYRAHVLAHPELQTAVTVEDVDSSVRSGATLARELRDLVRRAQRDFEFSVIFEQRKTNELLTAGFENLGTALSTISERIEQTGLAVCASVHHAGWMIQSDLDRIRAELVSGHSSAAARDGARLTELRRIRRRLS
jgi:hypothetical protein